MSKNQTKNYKRLKTRLQRRLAASSWLWLLPAVLLAIVSTALAGTSVFTSHWFIVTCTSDRNDTSVTFTAGLWRICRHLSNAEQDDCAIFFQRRYIHAQPAWLTAAQIFVPSTAFTTFFCAILLTCFLKVKIHVKNTYVGLAFICGLSGLFSVLTVIVLSGDLQAVEYSDFLLHMTPEDVDTACSSVDAIQRSWSWRLITAHAACMSTATLWVVLTLPLVKTKHRTHTRLEYSQETSKQSRTSSRVGVYVTAASSNAHGARISDIAACGASGTRRIGTTNSADAVVTRGIRNSDAGTRKSSAATTGVDDIAETGVDSNIDSLKMGLIQFNM